jgi:hypothetical protein
MNSDRGGILHDVLRRLHARGLELPEWLALLIVGGGVVGVNGFNLGQLRCTAASTSWSVTSTAIGHTGVQTWTPFSETVSGAW